MMTTELPRELTDQSASDLELEEAIKYWRKYRTVGGKTRVREAIAYWLQSHRSA